MIRRVYECSGDNRKLLWRELLKPKRAAPITPSWWQMLVRMLWRA